MATRAILSLAYLGGLYLILELAVADPDTEDLGFAAVILYASAWGFGLGRWGALLLPMTVVPAALILALVSDEAFRVGAGDEPGYLGWALVIAIVSLPAALLGIGARRLVPHND